MKYQLKWMTIILVGVLIMLACGPFGNQAEEAAQNLEATAQAAAQEAQKDVEAAAEEAQEAAKEVEQEAQKAAEAAQEKAEEMEEQAAEVAEEVQAEAEEVQEEVEEQAAEVSGEVVELQTENIQTTLQDLSSFRWQFNVSYDGQNQAGEAEQGEVNVLIEAIKEPAAFHMEMQLAGQPADEMGAGSANIQMYSVEGMTYVQNPEDGTWISFPAEGGMSEFFENGFLNPDEIIELPENARRSLLPETVNGISTWHYTFTEEDISEENLTIEDANGDIWVAQDGNYPVKFELELTGSSTGDMAEEFFASGTLRMSYELIDINESFTIELPEEARNAEGFGDMMGGSTDPADIPYPILADAEIDFSMEGLVSYKTASTISEAVEFYKAELPNEGWENDTESEFVSEDTALLLFTREASELSLIIAREDDGSTSVLLTEQEP